MGIKDLFGKRSNQILTKQKLDSLLEEVESDAYVVSESISRQEFIPRVDLSDPANFAHYGLAEKYYSDSIASIYTTYPYDGSATEKINWTTEASLLDRYLFDTQYPRTTGYITLNGLADHGTVASAAYLGATYRLMANPQSVGCEGGPHRDPSVTVGSPSELSEQYPEKSGNANIYAPADNRSTNLAIDGTVGNTVEFFTKVDDLGPLVANTNICLFDSWNGEAFASANYARFLVEYSRLLGFMITYSLDPTGAGTGPLGYEQQQVVPTATVMSTSWQHLAVSVIDSGADSIIRIYVDGTLDTTFTVVGGALGVLPAAAQLNMQASLGALLTTPSTGAPLGITTGYGGYNDLYFDEFRFWKEQRTSKDVGRNWITQVNGGTNTDIANTELGVYYKFNEGIMDAVVVNPVDASVLDYSGRITNGTILNYDLNVRSLDSAIDEFVPALQSTEFRDPIIYSDHPEVQSLMTTLTTNGRSYDFANGASLYKSLPAWIAEEEESASETGTLKNLTQALASYFDNLYLQIEALPHIKDVHYTSFQEGEKPYAFAKDLLKSAGLIAPELFVDASVLEELVSRSETDIYEHKINVVKNLIYQNIYNNLVYIYKSKGTEKSFRNLLRCFGVDDELIKINMYADGVDHKIRDNVRHTAIKKKYADFNDPDRWSATVHQYDAGVADTRSYILCDNTAGTAVPAAPAVAGGVDYLSFTVEAEVIFPKKPPVDARYIAESTFISGSLFGMHEADIAAPANLAWTVPDNGNFQVYAMKESAGSDNVFFRLVSLAGGYAGIPVMLDSPVFKNVYDNEKWNFAVRFRVEPTEKEPWLVDEILGSTETAPGLPTPDVSYSLEFYGVNSTQDTVENEFSLSTTIPSAESLLAIRAGKRLYCGAHRADFDGAVLQQSDAKISSVRFWFDYLDDDTIKYHSYDVTNAGRLRPDDPAYFGPTSLDGPTPNIEVPQLATLALDWNFDNVTGSDGLGEFVVADYSSGSLDVAITNPAYDWFSSRASFQHSAQGEFFPVSNVHVIDTDYISTAKQEVPDIVASSDMINILTQEEEEVYTRDSRPIKYFFAVEKSLYQAVSAEIINVFAGIAHFNKLIGDPVNRYRISYKPLEKLKQFFFERKIEDVASLEKYIDFYKWLDSSVDIIIQQLFPASANFSEEMRTMIESHVLERNKYWSKFPTLEMKRDPIEGQLFGIKELLYDWEHGHATLPVPPGPCPPGADGNEDCLWKFQRVERSNLDYCITSGDAIVDAVREILRKVAIREVKGNTKLFWNGAAWVEQGPTFYDLVTAASYEGSTYAVRQLSRPYRFGVREAKTIHGGTNFNHGRKPVNEFIRATTKLVTAAVQGLEIDDTTAMPGNRTGNRADPACIDSFTSATPPGPFDKFENARSVAVTDATAGGYENTFKGALGLPFNYYSTAPNDYTNQIRTNIHSDAYGDDNEVPMQGPFTNQWVGGNQHRHVTLTTTALDTNRPELYTETTAPPYTTLRHPHSVSTAAYAARYTRGLTAKRPVNIANIKTVPGATEDADSIEMPIGNYMNEWDVVKTSTTSTSRWFIRNDGVLPITTTSTFSTYVLGLVDFALPDRSLDSAGSNFGASKHIFAERFSAPGSFSTLARGSLDMVSEEKSPYATLNYRNLMVREHLNFWLANHADQFGYRDSYIHDPTSTAVVGAWQKNNRNPFRRIVLNIAGDDDPTAPGIYAEKAIYDNFFVKHQIPRSDWQYSWITGSALPNGVIDFGDLFPLPGFDSYPRLSGFASTYGNVSLDVSPDLLLSGSLNYIGGVTKDIDFAGLNTLIYDPTDFNTGLTGYDCLYCSNTCDTQSSYFLDPPSTILDPDLNTILLNRNGPYQYPSWKQIRTGQRKYVRNLRKKNILAVQDPPSLASYLITSQGRRIALTPTRGNTFTNYLEPPCAWNQPMTTTMVNAADTTGVGVRHTYSNNLELFANPKLTNRLAAIKCDKQVYDRLLEMYAPEIPADAHAVFTSIAYGEYIYPKHRYVGLHGVRQRNAYGETAEKIRNNPTGYAAVGLIGKAYIRTFWKTDIEDRARLIGSYNALGYAFNIHQYNKHLQRDSVWALDDYTKWAGTDTTLGFTFPPTSGVRPSDGGVSVDYQILGDLGYVGVHRYDEWISDYSRAQTVEVVSTVEPASAFSSLPPLFRPVPASIVDTFLSSSYAPDELASGLMDCLSSSIGSDPSELPLVAPLSVYADLIDEALVAFYTTGSSGTGIYSADLIGDVAGTTGRTLSVPRTVSVAHKANVEPRPSLQYLYNPFNPSSSETGWSWRTGEISGKAPWYNTYGAYDEEVRLMGQNYGIIPEFRVSEHMDFYITEQASNFRAKNYNYLSIEGGQLGRNLSGETTLTVAKVFSRTGNGIYTGTHYPTSFGDIEGHNLIRNNAFYDVIDDFRPEARKYKDYNHIYITSGSNSQLSDSVMIGKIFSRTTVDNKNPLSTFAAPIATTTAAPSLLRAPTTDWVRIAPYNGCLDAGMRFNLECERGDYLDGPINKFGNAEIVSLYNPNAAAGDHGDAFTLSFWVQPDTDAMANCDYVGSVSLSGRDQYWVERLGDSGFAVREGDYTQMGIWLKCPTVTAGLFNGTEYEGVGGLTFYMGAGGGDFDPTTGTQADNIFHFMKRATPPPYNFIPAILPSDRMSHIVLQYIPQQAVAPPGLNQQPRVMMWLNGERLYGTHPFALAASDPSAYSVVEPGYNALPLPYVAGSVGARMNDGCALNAIILGKGHIVADSTNREDYFQGVMSEVSLWKGILTEPSVSSLYGANADNSGGGNPTNILEDFYNYILMSQYATAPELSAHYGPLSPTILPTAYTMAAYSIALSATHPMLAELPLWWRVGVPFTESITDSESAYSDSFFDQHAHTDIVKYMGEVIEDHDDGTPQRRKRIRLKANVVKKLLPYNGFYPSQRTVQLGHLLKEDYFSSIARGADDPDAFWDSQRLQALVQCFFAPGILYNSIKSGLAVDWPAFTNDTGLEPPNYGARLYLNKEGEPEGVERYYGAEAPNWYAPRPEPFSNNTVENPSGLKSATECFEEQPKYQIPAITTGAGFIILDEPSTRIPFEGLLSPHSVFVPSSAYKQARASQELGLQSIMLDIDGYDCEGNNVTLGSPYFTEEGGEVEIRSTVASIRRSRWGADFGTTDTMGDLNILVGFYKSPWVAPPATLSENIAIDLCDAINGDPSCLWVALRPVVPLMGGGPGRRPRTQTDYIVDDLAVLCDFRLIDASPLPESYVKEAFSQGTPQNPCELVTGRQSSGSFRIKLVYVGPPSETKNVFDEFSPESLTDLSIDTKYNMLRRGTFQGGLGGLSSQATVSIAQTFASLAGTAGYFTDRDGTLKLYSSLSTIGIKAVKSDMSLDTHIDSPLGTPSQTRSLHGGIESAEEAASVGVEKKPSQFFLMAPEYYTGSQSQIIEEKRYPYFEFEDKRAPTDNRYTRAMHNFLAEVPSFFLEGGKLTSFASAPEDQFESMEAGKTYYMDVSLYKTKDFHTVLSPQGRLGDRSVPRADGKYFGPAFQYKNTSDYGSALELVADPAQAPYTPSYFYGKTTARLSFTATENRKYTLDEIFAGLKIEENTEEVRQYFNKVVREQRLGDSTALTAANSTNADGCELSPAYTAKMPLASSVNLIAKGKVKTITYNLGSTEGEQEQFVAATASDTTTSKADAWVISTKFESPMLNFNNKENLDYLNLGDVSDPPVSEGIGVWSGYGKIPEKEEGVFIELNYSFKLSKGDKRAVTALKDVGSLIDVCKFSPSAQRIGRTAEEKVISEAIVMIPFLDEKQSSGPPTIALDGREVFAIEKGIYNLQKRNVKAGKAAVPTGSVPDFFNSSDILETSISNMIKMMDKYNVPPCFNFSDYGDDPFVMYFLEFNHKLDQGDLTDIWQGLMPDISTRAERDSEELVHDLSPVDFFGGDAPPKDVRWLVFRVKQKGKKNYFASYGKSLSDSRFSFDFNLGEDASKYSYNWPYDFFSLIELSQIEGGVEIFDDESYEGNTSFFGELPAEKKLEIYNSPIGRAPEAIKEKIKKELQAGQQQSRTEASEFGADGADK